MENNNSLSRKILIVLIIIALATLIYLFISKINNTIDLSVQERDIQLEVGESKKIIMNSNANVNFKSNNENIVTVDEEGNIKALSYGNTTITITSKSQKKSTYVNVSVLDDSELSVKSIDIISSNTHSKEYVKKGDNLTINIIFNHNINKEPKILINEEKKDYKYNSGDNHIVIYKDIKDENDLLLKVIVDNELIYSYNLPKIDNEKPSCQLTYENETIKINGNDNYGINGYAISKTNNYIYTSNNELKINDYGTWYGYVRDYAGNEGKCSIETNAMGGEIDPTNITIIGDSRMEDLCRRRFYKDEHGTCIAEISKGYNWFVNTAIGEVRKVNASQKKYIVTNLGVNDPHNIKRYVSKYEELAVGEWKDSVIFLLSVNPTKEPRTSLNSDINSFNSELIGLASRYQNISYCDSNSYLKKIGFQSNDGVHYTQSTDKDIYEYLKQCIRDFYR